jgi:hypothetical protein
LRRWSDETNEEKWTKAEILQMLLAPRPKPAPKPAAVKAEERWSRPKPIEAVIRDEAAHNEALVERLRAERRAAQEAEFLRSSYQGLVDRVWQNQLDYQASLADLAGPSFHRGPGDPDW